MSQSELGQALRRSPGFIHRNIAGEALLIPIRAQVADLQAAYLLNDTAEFVYLHLDGRRGAGELAALLAETFDVDPDRAEEDVQSMLELLKEIGAAEESA